MSYDATERYEESQQVDDELISTDTSRGLRKKWEIDSDDSRETEKEDKMFNALHETQDCA